jgi:hypothetical protein
MVVFVLMGGGLKKEITIDEAMEALCHTWVNTEYNGKPTQKDIYHKDGTYGWYQYVTDTDPAYKGTFTIEEAWTDRKEILWIKAKRSFEVPYVIFKISDSGRVLEMQRFIDGWPEDIKSIRFYVIYYRQE